jgi:2-dehydro-3-deoxy-D-arabinonate dehydratase
MQSSTLESRAGIAVCLGDARRGRMDLSCRSVPGSSADPLRLDSVDRYLKTGDEKYMKLYRTTNGVFVGKDGSFYPVSETGWDELVCGADLGARVLAATGKKAVANFDPRSVLAPVVSQEVWAAGVTYYRSRNARMEESRDAGGGSFYDRVYAAERPELFFKATGRSVIGPGKAVRIRSDARWSVPEPELTLLINPAGAIVGYTIGNDMSSRDIEGENPLYLPQAKVYDGSCALGPCILLSAEPPSQTAIKLEIARHGKTVFQGNTTVAELKRTPQELVSFLFRENSFPQGVFLMTGTGIVPDDDFTLAGGDAIRITIDGIGTLENSVA